MCLSNDPLSDVAHGSEHHAVSQPHPDWRQCSPIGWHNAREPAQVHPWQLSGKTHRGRGSGVGHQGQCPRALHRCGSCAPAWPLWLLAGKKKHGFRPPKHGGSTIGGRLCSCHQGWLYQAGTPLEIAATNLGESMSGRPSTQHNGGHRWPELLPTR